MYRSIVKGSSRRIYPYQEYLPPKREKDYGEIYDDLPESERWDF